MLTHTQCSISRFLVTSSRTLLVAVAVHAIHGVLAGISERSEARREKEGLKSLLLHRIEQLKFVVNSSLRNILYIDVHACTYHLEMQWASSITRATILSDILPSSN